MSSILKALHRLQEDRGAARGPEPRPALREELAREVTRPPLSTTPKPADAVRARTALRVAPIVALLLAVAAGGWWLVRGGIAAPPVAGTPSSEAANPAPALPAATAPVSPAAVVPVPPLAAAPVPAAAAEPASVPPAAPPDPRDEVVADVPPRWPASQRPTTGVPRFEVVAEGAASPAPASPVRGAERPAAAPPDPMGSATPGPIPSRAKPAESGKLRPATTPPLPKAASGAGVPAVEILRTKWHPRPERRVARLRVEGIPEPVDVHEGDAVSTLVVTVIEPSGVRFLHGSHELRRGIGGDGAGATD